MTCTAGEHHRLSHCCSPSESWTLSDNQSTHTHTHTHTHRKTDSELWDWTLMPPNPVWAVRATAVIQECHLTAAACRHRCTFPCMCMKLGFLDTVSDCAQNRCSDSWTLPPFVSFGCLLYWMGKFNLPCAADGSWDLERGLYPLIADLTHSCLLVHADSHHQTHSHTSDSTLAVQCMLNRCIQKAPTCTHRVPHTLQHRRHFWKTLGASLNDPAVSSRILYSFFFSCPTPYSLMPLW